MSDSNNNSSTKGWIKLHRSILEWEWWDDLNTRVLFLYCLLKANPNEKKWRGKTVERGTFLSGRSGLAKGSGLSERSVRTALSHLIETGEIAIEPTNEYTIIRVCNYDKYQVIVNDERPTERPSTDQAPTNERPSTDHYEESKEYRENNNKPLSAHTRTREEQYEAVIAVFVDFKSSIGQVYVPHWPTQTTDATQLGDQLRQAYGEQWEDSDWRGLLDKAWRTADNFERKNFTLHYICAHFDSFLNRPDMQTAAEEQPKEVCGFRIPTEKERAMAILNS